MVNRWKKKVILVLKYPRVDYLGQRLSLEYNYQAKHYGRNLFGECFSRIRYYLVL